MATISSRLERTRSLHYVDDEQYKDVDAVIDINTLIREAYLYLRNKWDVGETDAVINQNEYKADVFTGTPNLSIIDIEKLWVKYGSKYILAKPCSYRDFDENTNYSEACPIFYHRDDSVFLYPAFSESKDLAIKIEAKYEPKEIALTDDESEIKLPSWIIDCIFDYGIAYYIEMTKGNKQEAKNARAEFRRELSLKKGLTGSRVRGRENDITQKLNKVI